MIDLKIKIRIDKISRSNIKVFILLGILITFVYAQTFNFQFTALDDYDLIVKKFHLLSRIENLPDLFKSNFSMSESGVYYRPFVSLTFMLDTILGGKNAFLFHLSNLVYHIIGSFLFFILLNLFLKNRIKSLLLSLVFAVHPSLSQAVVWIPGRNDSLLFIFLAITFLCFYKYLKVDDKTIKTKYLYLILSGISFFISLLTKENSFLILIFIILYQLLFTDEKFNKKELVAVSIIYIIPLLIYLLLRNQASIKNVELDKLTLSVFDYIKGIINYTGNIFFPFNLNVITLSENINVAYGLSSIVLVFILSLFGIEDKKIFIYGILWFSAFLISGIVGLTGFTNFLDHRLYIPIFGFSLSLSQLKIFDKIPKRVLTLFYTLIVILFIVLNISHSKNFSNPITFYSSAIKSAPNSFFVQRGMANVYHRMKNYEMAEKHYLKSLELNPNSFETLNNIALNFKSKGELDSAEFYFLKALKIAPAHSITYNNLGNLYLKKNNPNLAEYYLSKAVEINPDYFEAYNNLGVLYARLNNNSLAYKNFLKSIELNPEFAEGYFNLALFFYNQNKIDSSRYYYNKAIENGFPNDNF